MKLNNLQALRAIAAINVVMFHTLGSVARTRSEDPGALAVLLGWGANGVDIFFVLSGFVIYLSQAQKPKTPGRFLWNRVIRIVPNYWAWTLSLFAALVAPQLFPRLEAGAGHLAASLLFVSQPFTGLEPVFYVGWTLEYEMLFYALFWAALWIRVPQAPLIFIPAALLLLALVAGLPLLALEFLFGVLIALAFLAASPILPPVFTFTAGVGGLLASIALPIPGGRIVEWGIPAFLLVHGAVFLPEWKSAPLRFLGNASYSIYLVQVVSIPVVLKLALLLFPQLPSDLLTLLIVAATVTAGALNYVWFERPASGWLQAIGSQKIASRYA